MTLSRLALLLFGIFTLAGCAESAPDADGARDTGGGVPTVELGGLDSARVWRFGTDPVVDIGGAEPLVQVTGAVRVGDRIVVAEGGAHQLRIYDLAGTLLRTAGREGDGPGEFRSLAWIGTLPGDSVAAWDARLRRLSVYSPDGTLRRSAQVAIKGLFPSVQGVFADGSLLIAAQSPTANPPASAAWRDTAVYLRVSLSGEVRDTIGRFPGPEQYAAPGGERTAFRTYGLPFGRETFAAVRQDRAILATGDGYEATAYDPHGRAASRLRVRLKPRPVAPSHVAAYRAAVLESLGEADWAEWTRALDAAPYPREMPALGGLAADGAGHVWVRAYQPLGAPESGSRWHVFDAEWRSVANVHGPARFQPFQIGADWVLGRWVDGDGAEHVRTYPLVKP